MTKKRSRKSVSKDKHSRTLTVMGICALALLGGLFYARWQSVQSYATYPLQVWDQGDTVQSSNISFRINNVRADMQDVPGYWELPEGSKFLIFNITFINKTHSTYQLSPIKTMYIQDISNNRYPVTSAPSITQPFGGEVVSGQSATGEVGLIVPQNLNSLQFAFDPRTPGDPLILTKITLPNHNE